MFNKIFEWFENRIDTYPDDPPQTPKSGVVPFIFEATKGMRGYLVLLTILVASVGVIEAVLFQFMGDLIGSTVFRRVNYGRRKGRPFGRCLA